jgi:hypothetical protein
LRRYNVTWTRIPEEIAHIKGDNNVICNALTEADIGLAVRNIVVTVTALVRARTIEG